MDSKKIIQKLIKIANNQQKIIEKLAQGVPNAQLSNQPPPEDYSHNMPRHMPPDEAIKAKLPTGFYASNIASLEVNQGTLAVTVVFNPGKYNKNNFDVVQQATQAASNNTTLPGGPFTVRAS